MDSIHGPFIINRHCRFQADALIKTGRPHIQPELDTMMHIVDQLPEDCVLVDGGANAGLVCIPLARRVLARGGKVHAFEPQRTLCYALCGSVALNDLGNVTAHNMGLASSNTTMTVPPLDYGAVSDFGTTELAMRPVAGGYPIPVVRLDALGLERLDFLKLDIEGMECDALRGAQRLLRAPAMVLDRVLESGRAGHHGRVRRPGLQLLQDGRAQPALRPASALGPQGSVPD